MGTIIGAIVGVFIVRLFLLNPLEELAWLLFWEALKNVEFHQFTSLFSPIDLMTSSTFWKIFIGAFIGSGIGQAILESSNQEKNN